MWLHENKLIIRSKVIPGTLLMAKAELDEKLLKNHTAMKDILCRRWYSLKKVLIKNERRKP